MTDTSPVPPSDTFWTKYSPNHEFPIAMTASVVLYGLGFATFFLIAMSLLIRWHGEASASPSLDVAMVKDQLGDGQAPGGGGPGIPGDQTEQVDVKTPEKNSLTVPVAPTIEPFTPALQVRIEDFPSISNDTKIDFDKVLKSLENSLTPPSPAPAKPSAQKGNNGKGGGEGGGIGTGKGPGVGPGRGTGGTPGGLTRAEILAYRWRFDPTGSPREHVKKLQEAGIIVAFVNEPNGQMWRIVDLKKRPVDVQLEPAEKHKDTVKWYSQNPNMVIGVAKELRLPVQPLHFILLLPKDREQRFADAEYKYALDRGRDLKQVQATWFDFRPAGGSYEPVVIAQPPFDSLPPK
jgi:hypothetical protein